ncbi:MAG: glycine/betaine ABC transporter substrate-binding protein, partial [Pisciglobus halotolerans]|nr:glycine/betaine ABC transporter substrate-binding protein [Pisciglobus halotolerans]
MSLFSIKKVGLTAGVAASLILGACSSDDASKEDTVGKGQEVDLSYVAWDTEIASTNVLGAVLEDLGYDVKLTQLDNAITWESVATGESDAMVSAWLPGTHASQYEKYKDDLDNLGENLEGAKIGMAVPAYMDGVDSIEDLTDEADKKITGIEPGAGVVNATEEAVDHYDNLDGWEVQTSSSGAMTTALG